MYHQRAGVCTIDCGGVRTSCVLSMFVPPMNWWGTRCVPYHACWLSLVRQRVLAAGILSLPAVGLSLCFLRPNYPGCVVYDIAFTILPALWPACVAAASRVPEVVSS